MFKNVASQKVAVYAWDSANSVPKTGDAANITAYISKDGGSVTVSNDANPTELDATNFKGWYLFDLLIGETDCDLFGISPVSATADIVIEPIMIYTNPPNYTAMGIEADGDLTKVNLCAVTTENTDMYASTMRGTDNAATAAEILTTALTEAYGASGATRTLAQLLYEIKSILTNKDVAGTLLTSYKLDGSTGAKTYTLDSSTAPTAIEETT